MRRNEGSQRRGENPSKPSAEPPERRFVPLERRRSPGAPIVLFFDLVYAFAISQLTRCLLLDFTVGGLARTTILLLAAWAIWVLTTWVITYYHAELLPLRFMLVGVMVMNMLMFASLPHTEAKWAFGVALPMSAIPFAWPAFLLLSQVVGDDELRMRFLRALLWAPVIAIPWIA